MKYFFQSILFMICISSLIVAQSFDYEELTGKISYKSSQNIYVKFSSTKGITEGDTLYKKTKSGLSPAVVVNYMSSTSCAGKAIYNGELKIGCEIVAVVKIEEEQIAELNKVQPEVNESFLIKEQSVNLPDRNTKKNPWLAGKFSVSSYSRLSNQKNHSADQRWRYRLSLNSRESNNSKLSFKSYFVFSYKTDEWNEVSEKIGKALKVYNLGAKYNYSEKGNIWLGRGINSNMSNIGAIDGLQIEHRFGGFKTGAIFGARPDFGDYGVNFKLAQFGAFVSREDTIGNVPINNSIALFEQTNDFKTDRRFIYFQHRNRLSKKIRVFFSSEVDLFKIENGEKKNEASLTNLYLSVRYLPSNWLSVYSSYDNRKNVIYYETFRSFADSLLDVSSRQGVKLRTRIKILNHLNLTTGFSYRHRSGDIKPSKNINGALSYSRIPIVSGSANISFTNLNTNYVNGKIFGIRYSKDFLNGLLNTSILLRNVEYDMQKTTSKLIQNIISIDLSLRAFNNFYLSAVYEGTFQSVTTFSSFYLNASARF